MDYDKKLGLKSASITFQDNPKKILSIFAFSSLALMGITGAMVGLSSSYYAFLGLVGAHYSWQIGTLNIKDKGWCAKLFKSNQWLGLIVLAGIISGRLFQEKNSEDEISI